MTEAHFKDIDSSYAKNCIEALYRYGVIEGNGGGNFNPDAYITRIETVKMINRMLFRGPLNDASSSFKDISGSYKDLGDVEESTRTHEATISSDGTETMTKYIQESLW